MLNSPPSPPNTRQTRARSRTPRPWRMVSWNAKTHPCFCWWTSKIQNRVLLIPLPQKNGKKTNSRLQKKKKNPPDDQTDVLFLLSGVSPQHWLGGAPGGPDFPVCGHQRRDHHPHQHGGQSGWRAGRHVQGLVRPTVQLDRESHQHAAAAGRKYRVSFCSWWALRRTLGAFCATVHLCDGRVRSRGAPMTSVEVWGGRCRHSEENINRRCPGQVKAGWKCFNKFLKLRRVHRK